MIGVSIRAKARKGEDHGDHASVLECHEYGLVPVGECDGRSLSVCAQREIEESRRPSLTVGFLHPSRGRGVFMCWKTDERERQVLPVIDPAATGRNIVRLRRQAGLSVRDMQALCGFTTPQAITSGRTAKPCRPWSTSRPCRRRWVSPSKRSSFLNNREGA